MQKEQFMSANQNCLPSTNQNQQSNSVFTEESKKEREENKKKHDEEMNKITSDLTMKSTQRMMDLQRLHEEMSKQDRENGRRLLELIKINNIDKIKTLLTEGCDCNYFEADQIFLGYLKTTKYKDLGYYPHSAHYTDNVGLTPLTFAIKTGNEEIFNLLLEHKADIHFLNGGLETPLFAACMYGRNSMVKRLIELGAQTNIITGSSFHSYVPFSTPLHVATLACNGETLEFIISKTQDKNNKANDGIHSLSGFLLTPFLYALLYRQIVNENTQDPFIITRVKLRLHQNLNVLLKHGIDIQETLRLFFLNGKVVPPYSDSLNVTYVNELLDYLSSHTVNEIMTTAELMYFSQQGATEVCDIEKLKPLILSATHALCPQLSEKCCSQFVSIMFPMLKINEKIENPSFLQRVGFGLSHIKDKTQNLLLKIPFMPTQLIPARFKPLQIQHSFDYSYHQGLFQDCSDKLPMPILEIILQYCHNISNIEKQPEFARLHNARLKQVAEQYSTAQPSTEKQTKPKSNSFKVILEMRPAPKKVEIEEYIEEEYIEVENPAPISKAHQKATSKSKNSIGKVFELKNDIKTIDEVKSTNEWLKHLYDKLDETQRNRVEQIRNNLKKFDPKSITKGRELHSAIKASPQIILHAIYNESDQKSLRETIANSLKNIEELLQQGADANFTEDNELFKVGSYNLLDPRFRRRRRDRRGEASTGMTPLMLAVQPGNLQLVQLLIQYKADINQTNASLESPLILALIHNCPIIAKYLLLQNADASFYTGYFGNYERCTTALHLAVNGLCLQDLALRREIIQLILNQGIDVNQRNYHQLTAVEQIILYNFDYNLSEYSKDTDTVKLNNARHEVINQLIAHGALLSSQNYLYLMNLTELGYQKTQLLNNLLAVKQVRDEIRLMTEADYFDTEKTINDLDLEILLKIARNVLMSTFNLKTDPQKEILLVKLLATLQYPSTVGRIKMFISGRSGNPIFQFDKKPYLEIAHGMPEECPMQAVNLVMDYAFNYLPSFTQKVHNLHQARLQYLSEQGEISQVDLTNKMRTNSGN